MQQLILSSSLLILILLVLRRVLRKKLSLRLQYALWLLVALRLLIPVQLGHSSLSLENLTKREASTHESQMHSPPQTQAQNDFSLPIVPPSPTTPAIQESVTDPSVVFPPSPDQQFIPSAPLASQQLPTVSTDPKISTPSLTTHQILNLVWACGALAMAVWFLTVNIGFSRRARSQARTLSIPHYPLKVLETDAIPSPCLIGIFHPVVYLLPEEDPRRRKHVLAHEYVHYSHGDTFWAFVRALCLCLYWFHPLVWLAAYLSKRDCELACDEGAIERLGEDERISYGKTLLHTLAQAGRPETLLQTATTMAESKNQMKERLEMIVHKPKKLLLAVLVLIIVVGLAVGCTFTAAPETSPPDSPRESTATEPTIEPDTEPTTDEVTVPPTESRKSYSDATVVDADAAEGYRLPKLLLDSDYGQEINQEIQDTFGSSVEEARGKYRSVDYSWSIVTLHPMDWFELSVDVLNLVVNGETTDGAQSCLAYAVDLRYGQRAVDFTKPEAFPWEIAKDFVKDLMNQYLATGSIFYDEATNQQFAKNVEITADDVQYWWTDEDSMFLRYPYYPPDGSPMVMRTKCISQRDPGMQGFTEPKVIELYSYTASDGSTNHIPLLLMDGQSALNINTDLLLAAYGHCTQAQYTWTVRGKLLSLAFSAKGEGTSGNSAQVYNFSLEDNYCIYHDDLFSLLGTTSQEFYAMLTPAVENQYFVLFPGQELSQAYKSIQKSIASEVLGGATPYLTPNGEIWALASIYQDGSFSQYLIPVSAPEWSSEYLSYKAVSSQTLSALPCEGLYGFQRYTSTRPGAASAEVLEQAYTIPIYQDPYKNMDPAALEKAQMQQLQKYLQLLYGKGRYSLGQDSKKKVPIYSNDRLSILSLNGELQIQLYDTIALDNLNEQTVYSIPELAAAIDYLGIENPLVTIQSVNEPYNYADAVWYYRYLITEENSSWVEHGRDSSFRRIEIIRDMDRKELTMHLYNITPTHVVKEVQTPVLMHFLAYFDYWDWSTMEHELSVELYYSDELQEGQYIPCYRIYTRDSFYDANYYEVYEVKLTDSVLPGNE